jgi:putative membrane-bound dehydrogenase-like protein
MAVILGITFPSFCKSSGNPMPGRVAPLLILLLVTAFVARGDEPRSLDSRLSIERFAGEPDVVTPTGITVDGRGRVLVIESHTHFRPAGYQGPRADRIRLLHDTDADGKPDRIDTFFEGTRATMNLAAYRDGSIYVATRAEVLRLRDLDGDGRADLAERLVHLKTRGDYPHNGLSGFAFDTAGRVYFGCGENLGASYQLVGSDGSLVRGGGEGGNIFRCDADGKNLVRLATGFWNPFHLCFDAYERLFAVDNDPDARPPCRLLHVVEGGDYGYRYRNGRRGLHPFTAWNGELPGTLPMVAGTGEAPSGVLAYECDGFPAEYRGQLFVTSWGDHRIDAFRLVPHGASVRGQRTTVVSGGEDFRPVGIALAPDGSLFISDWVDKSYELHGKGRVWRLRAAGKQGQSRRARLPAPQLHEPLHRFVAERLSPRRTTSESHGAYTRAIETDALLQAATYLRLALAPPSIADWLVAFARQRQPELRALILEHAGTPLLKAGSTRFAAEAPAVQAAALRGGRSTDDLEPLWQMATDRDPFLAQAARQALRRAPSRAWHVAAGHADPKRRMAALLLLRECDTADCRGAIEAFLNDPDATIRFAAVQWVAESGLQTFRPQLERQLAGGAITGELFEALLAAFERLDGVKRLPHEEQSGQQYVLKRLFDPGTAGTVRRRALRSIRPDDGELTVAKLWPLAQAGDDELRREVVQTLQLAGKAEARPLLLQLAVDPREDVRTRAVAVAGLAGQVAEQRNVLIALLSDPATSVRYQAWRSLRGAPLNREELQRLKHLAQMSDEATRDLAQLVLAPPPAVPATALSNAEQWLAWLDRGGDPEEGERVFFHPQGPQCYRCHQVDGRGGRAGPELSTAGRVLDRKRLIESIVAPGKEIAPQYVAWQLQMRDGTIKQGILVSEGADGEQTYADSEGRTFVVRPQDVALRVSLRQSLMPEGLGGRMTRQEFADLLAYLQART